MRYLLEGIESDRLLFRKLETSDYSTWLEFFKDPSATKYWSSETTDPEENCKKWFDKIFARYNTNGDGMNVLIEKSSGSFTGQCGLLLQTVNGIEELEIGYSLMPAFRQKGYATEAAITCRNFAFENGLSESLISIIHEENIPSQKVALNCGMKLDKKTIYKDSPVRIYRIDNEMFWKLGDH